MNIKNLLVSKKATVAVTLVGIYLLSSGASLAVFSYLKGNPNIDLLSLGGLEGARSKISADAPKTEECPINGAMYTKEERTIWEERRPITAMIENHVDSRPQSGISKADVVYEAVAEGGITRFLNIFYCGAAASDVKIAPVRSARVYFVDLAAGYGDKPIFMHVGGANDYPGTGDTVKEAKALEMLESMGWRVPRGNDFDTIYDSGYPVFWRDYERLDRPVATEHTMVASLDAAYTEAEKRNLGAKDSDGILWSKDFTSWKFMDDSPTASPQAEDISFEFWSNQPGYDVEWKYDKGSNSYLRYNGGAAHMDLEADTQLSAKNVVVMFTKEKGPVDRNKHMLYTVVGTGEAIVFQNGNAVEVVWEKEEPEDTIIFTDSKGKEISFVRGTVWVEVLPLGNDVSY